MAASDAYDYRRAQMVEALKRGGIDDQRLLEVMMAVPRHLFVPEALRHQTYSDDVSIHIGEGQTISQPRIVALMTQAAHIQPSDRVSKTVARASSGMLAALSETSINAGAPVRNRGSPESSLAFAETTSSVMLDTPPCPSVVSIVRSMMSH